MEKDLIFSIKNILEDAAIATSKELGNGNKNSIDNQATMIIREGLNRLPFGFEVVIGEGDLDDAPMLHNGELLGTKKDNIEYDIGIDPVEGTTIASKGQLNSFTTLTLSDKGSLLSAPDMFMEKIITKENYKDLIDIDLSIIENVKMISKVKPLEEIKVLTLDKPRHNDFTNELRSIGIKVFTYQDGDVSLALKLFNPENDFDIFYSIGGSPEGVICASIAKSCDGYMEAKFRRFSEIKPELDTDQSLTKIEENKLSALGLNYDKKMRLDDMIKSDNVTFFASWITSGDMQKGVKVRNGKYIVNSTIIDHKTKTMTFTQTIKNMI